MKSFLILGFTLFTYLASASNLGSGIQGYLDAATHDNRSKPTYPETIKRQSGAGRPFYAGLPKRQSGTGRGSYAGLPKRQSGAGRGSYTGLPKRQNHAKEH